jgi:hypothetical protein
MPGLPGTEDDQRLRSMEKHGASELPRESDVCCNACAASVALVATGWPLFLGSHACSGADGFACCDLPADGREVVATGRLAYDDSDCTEHWWLEDERVCQLTDGPEPEGPPASCPVAPAQCGYAFAASIALPRGLTLRALRDAAATLCRNDECATLDLLMLVAEDEQTSRACATRLPVSSPRFQVRLGDCDRAGSLIVTYDPRPKDALRDGDLYAIEVRSPSQALLLRWQRRVHYAAIEAQPGGRHCPEARIGELPCKNHLGRDLWCP